MKMKHLLFTFAGGFKPKRIVFVSLSHHEDGFLRSRDAWQQLEWLLVSRKDCILPPSRRKQIKIILIGTRTTNKIIIIECETQRLNK